MATPSTSHGMSAGTARQSRARRPGRPATGNRPESCAALPCRCARWRCGNSGARIPRHVADQTERASTIAITSREPGLPSMIRPREIVARGRIPTLDGLRGLAILGVILLHADVAHYSAAGSAYPGPLDEIVNAGWVGVDLFFVLSGFLITGILWDSKGAPRYFRNFYLRRVLRILPLYYGVLLVWT